MLIHLNGLRYPWDYLRLLKYSLKAEEHRHPERGRPPGTLGYRRRRAALR